MLILIVILEVIVVVLVAYVCYLHYKVLTLELHQRLQMGLNKVYADAIAEIRSKKC